jgi:hypothetical protein
MDKFIKKIDAYESKMENMFHDQKRKEQKAFFSVVSFISFIIIVILIVIYWSTVKTILIDGLTTLENAWDWILVQYFNYEIITEQNHIEL